MEKTIEPFGKAGFATRVPWLVNKYEPFPVAGSYEDTLYQDCLHRVRGKAEFIANPHADEFFFPLGEFATLPQVLLNAKKMHPNLAQVKLYEHPMMVAQHTAGHQNSWWGEPAELLTMMQNGKIKVSDIPCGRNQHYSDDHLLVTESEQPFEGILRPEYWESWHAPGGAIYSDDAPEVKSEYTREGECASGRSFSGAFEEDIRKRLVSDIGSWPTPTIYLNSQKEAAIFHMSPNYGVDWMAWESKESKPAEDLDPWSGMNCGMGIEGLGESDLNALCKAGVWDKDTWPIVRAKETTLTPIFSQEALDCMLEGLKTGAVTAKCKRA